MQHPRTHPPSFALQYFARRSSLDILGFMGLSPPFLCFLCFFACASARMCPPSPPPSGRGRLVPLGSCAPSFPPPSLAFLSFFRPF
jgi:hypothetical protein